LDSGEGRRVLFEGRSGLWFEDGNREFKRVKMSVFHFAFELLIVLNQGKHNSSREKKGRKKKSQRRLNKLHHLYQIIIS
jgi:hypothetical protein